MPVPRNDGQPVKFLTKADKADIIERLERQVVQGSRPITKFVQAMAAKYDKDEVTIWRFIRSVRDTTSLARAYFRAKAYTLTKRVVEKANVDQSIDILTRPNMGVLDPINRDGNGATGVFVSVSAGSCGAIGDGGTNVRVGVAQRLPQPQQGEVHEGRLLPTGEGESGDVWDDEGGINIPPAITQALARRRTSGATPRSGDEGVQGDHEQPQQARRQAVNDRIIPQGRRKPVTYLPKVFDNCSFVD